MKGGQCLLVWPHFVNLSSFFCSFTGLRQAARAAEAAAVSAEWGGVTGVALQETRDGDAALHAGGGLRGVPVRRDWPATGRGGETGFRGSRREDLRGPSRARINAEFTDRTGDEQRNFGGFSPCLRGESGGFGTYCGQSCTRLRWEFGGKFPCFRGVVHILAGCVRDLGGVTGWLTGVVNLGGG